MRSCLNSFFRVDSEKLIDNGLTTIYWKIWNLIFIIGTTVQYWWITIYASSQTVSKVVLSVFIWKSNCNRYELVCACRPSWSCNRVLNERLTSLLRPRWSLFSLTIVVVCNTMFSSISRCTVPEIFHSLESSLGHPSLWNIIRLLNEAVRCTAVSVIEVYWNSKLPLNVMITFDCRNVNCKPEMYISVIVSNNNHWILVGLEIHDSSTETVGASDAPSLYRLRVGNFNRSNYFQWQLKETTNWRKSIECQRLIFENFLYYSNYLITLFTYNDDTLIFHSHFVERTERVNNRIFNNLRWIICRNELN